MACNSSPKKNLTLDIAKGAAIILVVYGHVIEHSMAPFHQDFFADPVFKAIYTFHMPLFVFISGYLMADSLERHALPEVFLSRCKSLLVPFISLAVLGVFLTFGLNRVFGNYGAMDFTAELANQLLLKPSVWFLFTLFAASALLILSVLWQKRTGRPAFILIYMALMFIPGNTHTVLYYIQWFYLFYLAGYAANKSKIDILGSRALAMILPLCLMAFGWGVWHWTEADYIYINKMHFVQDGLGGELLRLAYRYGMGFMGIVIILCFSSYCSRSPIGKLLGRVGQYSLDIYVLQMFFLEGIYPRWLGRAGICLDCRSETFMYIMAVFITIAITVLCIFLSKLWLRRSQPLNAFILGGRAPTRAIKPLPK